MSAAKGDIRKGFARSLGSLGDSTQPTLDPVRTAEVIRTILLTTWPHRFTRSQLADDISLGNEGLGLESVEIVEVLLACEQQCGGRITPELFANLPLTVRSLADHFVLRE
jgi:acyl carrier protein